MQLTDFNMDMFSLKGKNAIVTGGNSGLGQAFSTALAKAGANVMAASLMDDGGETRKLVEEKTPYNVEFIELLSDKHLAYEKETGVFKLTEL